MAAGPLTTAFSKSLTKEQQSELSKVIDEIERETYTETRRDILDLISRRIKEGDIEEYVQYLINKKVDVAIKPTEG